jgi:transcription termination factor NusB|eukprot:scaffold795_cov270-Chaetoceros_neogracile.AAC.5
MSTIKSINEFPHGSIDGAETSVHPSKYSKLLLIISKAIKKSHSAISTPIVIEKCYGEDAAIFETGGDGDDDGCDNLLVGLLDTVLEKIDEELMEQIETIVKDKAESKLNNLDAAITNVNGLEQKAKEKEEHDRQSAQDAIRMSKIPQGIGIEDIMLYQAYFIQKKARDELLESVKSAQKECAELKEKLTEKEEHINKAVDTLNQRGESMSKAANICSFNGVS